VSAELIYPDGAEGPGFPEGADEGFQIDAGLRIRGGFSRTGSNPKHAFRLFFRSEYGDGKLNYPLFGDEGVSSFDNVDLRTAQNYSWSFQNDSGNTMCRDVWARDSQGQTGQGYTRSRYYHLYINGQYWGIYQTQERSEASFAASYFGGDREEYDTVKAAGSTGGYTTEVTDGTFDAWRRLWDLAARGFANDANYYHAQGLDPITHERDPKYEVLLDVDNLIEYMMIIFYDGDRDAPISEFLGNTRTNNWFGVRNRNGEEGFRFFVHDAEHTLSKGMTDKTGPFPCGDQFQYSNPQWIHQQLVAHPECRLRFADHAHKDLLNGGLLTADPAIERFLARAAQIDTAIIAESARWGNSSLTKSTWQNAINNEVRNFFPSRSQIVLNQLKSKGWYPDVEAPAFSQHGGSFAKGFTLSMSASGTVYYTLDGTDPREPGTGLAVGDLYGGPVPLEMTTLVKARAFGSKGTWSALNEALFVLDTPSPLRITEIMYHSGEPSGDEAQGNGTADDFDFIELRNTGAETIGLAGIKFTDGVAFDFTRSDIRTLAPDEYVVLVKNKAAFAIRYPNWSDINIAGEFQVPVNSLANGGEPLTLKDGLGRTILSFEYDDEWCPTTDGLGFSLAILDENAPPDSWGRKSSWRPSATTDGSPGADDPPGPEIPAVVINEALTNSDLSAKDAIELYNPTARNAEVGGWYLTDDRRDPFKFRIPDGTEILTGHYFVFDEDDFNSDPSSPSSFLLSSLGEEVYLFSADSEGNLTGYGHGFRFGPSESDETLGRWVISTGEEHFVAQAAATLNSINAGPKVGPVVINEIMYNPPSGGATINTKYEYIELRNIFSETVTLFDPDALDNTWRIEGSVDYSFPTGVTLLPDDYIVLISFDPEADRKATTVFRYTYSMDESVRLFGPYDGTLGNSNGEIALLKPGAPVLPPDPDAGFVPYVLVDRVDYSDSAPWLTGANGTGDTLQRIASDGYGNDPINWQVASPTAGLDNAGAPVEDVDGDGLPDDWERTIVDFDPGDEIGEIADVQGEDDFDGDGESNLDEWVAGTDPTDASSILAISSIIKGIDSTMVIRWHSVSNRHYSILRSTDLRTGFDQIEAASVPATPPENSYTIDTGQARNAFYRIVVDE
ncbi:MAG: lamin tail domain-containing protein, partial [bacterium]|nr:lamin tail domain-containing protein [bacterium]